MRQQADFNDKQKKIYAWLEALGHPEKGKTIVHLAGTNGKGSAGTFIAQILSLTSAKVGHFSSPHVLDYEERIRINGKPVGQDDLENARAAIAKYQKEIGLPKLFYFEQSFIEALLLFQDLEWIVLESGIGGREDITNIIPSDYAVITTIARDHVDKLGTDLAQIASHKADIIEEGRPVFSANQQPEVRAVLEEVAAERKAPFVILDSEMYSCCQIGNEPSSGNATMTFLWNRGKLAGDYEIQMLGYHQVENAGVALLLAEALDFMTYEEVKNVLSQANLIGRLQRLNTDPPIWVDGAHNNQGIRQLIENMALFDIQDPMILFGMHEGKVAEDVRRELFGMASKVLFVQVEGQGDEAIEKEVHQYLTDLKAEGNEQDIVICGSLYILAAGYRFAENQTAKGSHEG